MDDDGSITIGELIRSGKFTANAKAAPAIHGLQGEVGDVFYLEMTGSNR